MTKRVQQEPSQLPLGATRFGQFRVLTLRETAADSPGESPKSIYDYYLKSIATDPRHNPDVESLYGVTVNTRKRITGHYLVAQGTLDTILADPREVFRPAIIANASAVVILHNHPSGDPSPSSDDIKITCDLIKAGQILRLDLLDHLVIGTATADRPRAWVSLRELGYFV